MSKPVIRGPIKKAVFKLVRNTPRVPPVSLSLDKLSRKISRLKKVRDVATKVRIKAVITKCELCEKARVIKEINSISRIEKIVLKLPIFLRTLRIPNKDSTVKIDARVYIKPTYSGCMYSLK